MEFKRKSVIDLYLAGKSKPDIVKALSHLNVKKMFVYRTIARYNDSGSIAKRYGGGKGKTATSAEMVRKVKARLEQNPNCSGNQMAKELKISQRSICRIFDELMIKRCKVSFSTSTSESAEESLQGSTNSNTGETSESFNSTICAEQFPNHDQTNTPHMEKDHDDVLKKLSFNNHDNTKYS